MKFEQINLSLQGPSRRNVSSTVTCRTTLPWWSHRNDQTHEHGLIPLWQHEINLLNGVDTINSSRDENTWTWRNVYRLTLISHWCADCGSLLGSPTCIYHLPGNVISATAAAEYEFSSSTRFGQFQKFGKFELGHCLPQPPTSKETISIRGLSSCW